MLRQLEKELDLLGKLAVKFKELGMTDKAHKYKAEINNLRLRLDRLKS